MNLGKKIDLCEIIQYDSYIWYLFLPRIDTSIFAFWNLANHLKIWRMWKHISMIPCNVNLSINPFFFSQDVNSKLKAERRIREIWRPLWILFLLTSSLLFREIKVFISNCNSMKRCFISFTDDSHFRENLVLNIH